MPSVISEPPTPNPREIQIARNGVTIGYLDIDELPDALEQEVVLPTDHGWHQGLTEWRLLSELVSPVPAKAQSLPKPAGPNPAKRNWRDDPATEKQINFLKSFGVTAPAGLTKGEASDLINKCQNDPQALQIQENNRMAEWEASMERERNERAQLGAYSFRRDVDKAASEIEAMQRVEADRIATKRAKRAELAALRRELKASPREGKEALEHQIIELDVELSDLDSELPLDPSDVRYAKEDLKQLELVRAKFWRCTFKDDWIMSSDASEYSELVDVADTINRLYDDYGRHFKMPTSKQIALVLEALDAASQDWDKLKPESFFATLRHNFPEQLRR